MGRVSWVEILMAKSFAPALVGFGSLVLTVVCAGILHYRGVPQRAEESPTARPPR